MIIDGPLLILAIVASGYVLVSLEPGLSFSTRRHSGQRLYAAAIVAGIPCASIGYVLAVILPSFGDLFHSFGGSDSSYSNYLQGGLILNFSLLVAVLIATLIGWAREFDFIPFVDSLEKVQLQEIENSPLDDLLHSSSLGALPSPILVTLKSGKVYLGRATACNEAVRRSPTDQDVEIWIRQSGFRDQNTKTVVFTTDYRERSDAFVAWQAEVGASSGLDKLDFPIPPIVVVKLIEIESVSLYDAYSSTKALELSPENGSPRLEA